MTYRIILAMILLVSMSCSKSGPEPSSVGQQQPESAIQQQPAASGPLPSGAFEQSTGARTMALSPSPAYAGSTISVKASGFHMPVSGGQNRVVWYVNGNPVSSVDPLSLDLREHLVTKGDTVQAVAILDGARINSNLVIISNRPPRITRYEFYDPGEASGNIGIDVEAEDADGDTVTIEYQWTINSLPAGNGKMADLSPSPKDDVKVSVRAFDGQEYSDEIEETFTLLNRPPRFERVEGYFIVGSTYIYNASASDPDHEAVIFSLDKEPPGMTIDSQSGQVRWDVPADFLGTVEYTIVAGDAQGLNAVLPMKFSVLKE